MVIQIHGDIYRQAEEFAPLARLPVINHGWLCLQDSSEEVSVPATSIATVQSQPRSTSRHTTEQNKQQSHIPVFVLAPVLKVFKHWVQLAVWITLQVPVDADVAPVTNLFREVCGVKDEFWLEEGVFSVFCQETKIQGKVKVSHSFVDEASVACFISALQNTLAIVFIFRLSIPDMHEEQVQ